jgi:carbonic anhydrase
MRIAADKVEAWRSKPIKNVGQDGSEAIGRQQMKVDWRKLIWFTSIVTLMPAVSSAQWRTPWTYEGDRGPDHWSDLDPAYATCNQGKEQSPIDIQSAVKAELPALQFTSRRGPLKYLINNGYTIRVDYHDAPGVGNLLVVGNKRYQLIQFHFHRPSEETIRGKAFNMVTHLMYKASDGTTAAVAVLMQAGKENPTIQQLWDHMPKKESKVLADFSHPGEDVPGVEIDPAGLLPRDLSYYTYVGSVTAPPCTEGIEWYVLKTPIEVSQKQIDEFAQLFPHDVRPVQPLNGRIVKETQ